MTSNETKKKVVLSTKQQNNNIIKSVETCIANKNAPTVRAALQARSIQLANLYLNQVMDITKKPPTKKDFCKKYSITENTLRKALRTISDDTSKANPNSNNIVKYHKEINSICKKVAIFGIDDLDQEEKIKYDNYVIQQKNKRERSSLSRAESLNDINEGEGLINATVSKSYKKPKEKLSKLKGGASNSIKEEENSSDDDTPDPQVEEDLKEINKKASEINDIYKLKK